MAKSPMPRAPRAPKGEKPAVTIANQAREIKNLITRCLDMAKQRDEFQRQAIERQNENQAHLDNIRILERKLHELNARLRDANGAEQRMKGWQDCAREVFDALTDK